MIHSLALATTIHADRLATADRYRLIRDLQPHRRAPRLRPLALALAALARRWDASSSRRPISGPARPRPATSA